MAVNILTDTTLDLWKVTLAKTLWQNKLEVFQTYNDYPVCNQIFRKDSIKEDGGTRLEWKAMLDDTGNANYVSPTQVQTYNISDVWGEFSCNWSLMTGYHAIVQDEIEANSSSAERLQSLPRSRRLECQMGMANLIEASFWRVPTGSTEEKAKQPYGVPYSCVPITSAQVSASTSGFQGANHTSYSDCYGVDSSATKYARYRNYNDVWSSNILTTDVLTEDDIDKINTMLDYLRWRGPITASEFDNPAANKMAFYTTQAMKVVASRKARENNDNLGADLGQFHGRTVTKGIAWNWAPPLDSETTSPLIAIDFDALVPVIHSKNNMVETASRRLPNQHRVIVTDVDFKWALICKNRRRLGRIDYVA